MATAALDLALGFGETPTLDVFEDDTTIPRRKKRRSSARRVSFAEIQTVHVFPRDDEYATPPGGALEVAPQPLRKSPRLAARRSQSFDSTDQNVIVNDVSEDGEEAAGPVDINHIVQANLGSPSLEDDITLDSTTFSAKLCRFNDDDTAAGPEVVQDEASRRPGSLESDMSFTVQNPRRPPEPLATDSTPVSLDRTLSMQYTEMVDAGALAQKRRRVFRASPRFKGKENRSPLSSARSATPKKLQDIAVTSSPPSPARSIAPEKQKLQDIAIPQLTLSPPSPARSIAPKKQKLQDIALEELRDTTVTHQVPSPPSSARSTTPDKLKDITVTPQVARSTAPEKKSTAVTSQVPLTSPKQKVTVSTTPVPPRQDPSPVASPIIPMKSNLSVEDQEKELAELRSKLQEMQDKNDQLKATMKVLEDRKRDFSLTSEACKMEHCKCRMNHKMQGWHITRLVSERESYKLDISHSYRVNQSVTIEAKGAASSAWIQLTPELTFIEKGFPRMNSALLFQSLLPGEKHRVKQLKSLPAAMQQSSDLVTNLIQVCAEARDCRAHHRCLDSVLFMYNKDHGICLQFDFINYRLRVKITLVFSLRSLNNGQYPKDIIPCEVLVDSTRRMQSVITEEDLNTAIYSLPAGYRRFHRICACVATFLP